VIVVDSRALLRDAVEGTAPVVLVPTMGALHAGHAALLDRAVAYDGTTVASIFVNPMQFGPAEDLSRYPRSLEADLEVCAAAGVDVVFTPTVSTMYPQGEPSVTVEPGPLASILEGVTRPGHFRGVLTVVAKLFGLVQPQIAVFGEKDYQQLTLIRQLVADLCIPTEVVGIETVRENDGLALSSRNRYLSSAERELALTLSRALRAGAAAGAGGWQAVEAAGQAEFASVPDVELDYCVVRAADLGQPPTRGSARLLVAAKVGSTRLIDNTAVALGRP
jgi:pantoate--beta-alanine ligase